MPARSLPCSNRAASSRCWSRFSPFASLPDGAAILAPLLDGAQAVLFTSANGVRAFAAARAHRDLAAFAVGDATATAARDAGFADIASAGGDVTDLAALVVQRLKPRSGALVHAAASEVAGDLGGALSPMGFELRRAVLYESVPAARLSDATAAALANGTIELALFFSPRTAELFVRLAAAAGLEEACRKVAAVALSPAVAARLEPLAWRAVHVAETPTLASLLAATDRAAAAGAPSHGSGGGTMTDERTDKPAGSRPAAPPRRRAAAWVSLAALLVVIVLIGSAPYWVSLLPWAQNQAPQLAALQARLDAADADRRAIEQRFAQLAAQQRPAATPPTQPDTAALDGLAHRIDALEGRAASAGDPSHIQAVTDALQKTSARLDAIEAHVANPSAASGAPDAATLDALAQRVDALEHHAPAAGSAPSDSATLDALSQRIDALEHRAPADLQPVNDALQKATARLDAIEARLNGLTAAAPAAQSESTDIARLAALAGLRAALASGAPYRDELALVSTLGGGDQKIAASVATLSHDAATGMPSRAILAARFRAVIAPAIRRAAAPATADDGSLGERALARVKGLVTIRRIDDGAADADPVAAALGALDRDDLAAAVVALKPLSGAQGEAARPWLDLAQRRLDAEAAATDLARQADASLAAHGEGR